MSQLNIQSVHFASVPNLLASYVRLPARSRKRKRTKSSFLSPPPPYLPYPPCRRRVLHLSPTRFPVYPILAQVGILIFNSCPEGTYSLQSVWPSPARYLPPVYTPGLLEHYLHVNLIYAPAFYKHRIEETTPSHRRERHLGHLVLAQSDVADGICGIFERAFRRRVEFLIYAKAGLFRYTNLKKRVHAYLSNVNFPPFDIFSNDARTSYITIEFLSNKEIKLNIND